MEATALAMLALAVFIYLAKKFPPMA